MIQEFAEWYFGMIDPVAVAFGLVTVAALVLLVHRGIRRVLRIARTGSADTGDK